MINVFGLDSSGITCHMPNGLFQTLFVDALELNCFISKLNLITYLKKIEHLVVNSFDHIPYKVNRRKTQDLLTLTFPGQFNRSLRVPGK